MQSARPETRQGRRSRHRDAARDAATAASHRRPRRALASGAARGRTARGGHPHAGRPDSARAQASTVVGRHRGARADGCPPHRGVLCPESRAHRTPSRTDHREPGAGTDPVGATGRPGRSRWLTGYFPSAAGQLRARRQQRLPGRERLAVAARVGGNPAGLPQGGRTADPVGNRRARAGSVVTNHRGRHCLPRLPASSEPPCALGRRTTASIFARVAPLRGRPLGPLRVLCAVRTQRPVPVAHRAALRAGQPVRRRQGARRPRSGCVSCWTSRTPRACESASS